MALTTLRVFLVCLICTFWSPTRAEAGHRFPVPRGSNAQLYGDWMSSPIVAVGEVSNIRSYGNQTVDHLPGPMVPWVHKLYWCQGDFRVIAVVKGELPAAPRKYMWASSLPGCKLYDDNPKLIPSRFKTRAWFLRVEGAFLRPTFDYGTDYFLGLCARWEDGPALPARQRLGELLLTPVANCATLEDYGDYLAEHVGDIACELLGKAECVQRIEALAQLGNAKLRTEACDYLQGQQETTCSQ